MIRMHPVIDHAPAGMIAAADRQGLAAIRYSDAAAVIWARQPVAAFQRWIDALDPAHLPGARLILRPQALSDALVQVCDLSGTPDCAAREWLIADMVTLGEAFAAFMRSPFLRVRLEAVSTDACRKFHVDAISARLICTYRGPGTQFGTALAGGEPQSVFSAPTGAACVMRGTLWPENPRSGLLHRSPAIAGSGQTRFVLVLDPISDPSEESVG